MTMQPRFSNYPHGFRGGLLVQNIPVLNTYPGKVFWVDSVNGADGNDGSFQNPWATIEGALNNSQVKASRGDIIAAKASHAETLTAAAAIALDKEGVTLLGMGNGDDMPTLTFTTAAGADIDIDQENCAIIGFRLVCGIASQTAMIDVNAAYASIVGCEFSESSATGLSCIDIDGGAANACDGFYIGNNRFLCTTAGNWDRAIELGEVANAGVIENNDIIGDFDDACIHNPTGAVLTNLTIRNNYCRNNQAGQHAIELVSACTGVAYGNRLVTDGITTAFDSGALANFDNKWNSTTGGDTEGVSVNPAATGGIISKAFSDLSSGFGVGTVSAFTVTGDVRVRVWGVVGGVAITSTCSTGTLSVGTAEAPTAILGTSTANGTQFAATDVWVDTSPANDAEATATDWVIIGGGADIIVTVATNAMTAGALTLYCEWEPLSAGATVVAA